MIVDGHHITKLFDFHVVFFSPSRVLLWLRPSRHKFQTIVNGKSALFYPYSEPGRYHWDDGDGEGYFSTLICFWALRGEKAYVSVCLCVSEFFEECLAFGYAIRTTAYYR